jgi:hypothetical protein
MRKGSHHKLESKEKMAVVRTGKHPSEESKEKNRLSHLGKSWSEETRALTKVMRATSEYRERMSLAHKGKQYVSEEGKKSISEKALARWAQPGFKEHFSESRSGENNPMYGKPLTEDHKKKDSEGVKRWWDVPENRAKMDAYHKSEEFLEACREGSRKGKISLLKNGHSCYSPGEEDAVKILKFHNVVPMPERQRWVLDIKHKYPADFYFSERNLIIEIDGSWHKRQDRQELDAIRGKELVEKGYNLLRFWDYELDKFEQFVIENLIPKKEVSNV